MNPAEPPPATPVRGWVFYDGHCPLCVPLVERWKPTFLPRGFEFAALQEPWVRQALGLRPGEIVPEIKLRRSDGVVMGGVDALRELAGSVWWMKPLAVLAGFPGFRSLARSTYRWVAANRQCLGDVCPVRRPKAGRRAHSAASTFFEAP